VIVVILRFNDLKKRGVVRNRPQLKRLQVNHGFPIGVMLSGNTRVWTEQEINDWLASRPTENSQPLKGAIRSRHDQRLARLAVDDETTEDKTTKEAV
jgi:hypothetical protein